MSLGPDSQVRGKPQCLLPLRAGLAGLELLEVVREGEVMGNRSCVTVVWHILNTGMITVIGKLKWSSENSSPKRRSGTAEMDKHQTTCCP